MNLKLATANIRFENIHDGDHSWENRRPLLQKILTEFHPDILGTQEGREGQIKSLSTGLPLKLVDSHRNWIQDRMYPCLYVNEELIKVLRADDIWLSETPHVSGSSSFKSAFPRLCTWAHVCHLPDGQEYIVINTHLDHVLEETRIEQIKVLMNEIDKLNEKKLPVILMGDFNESPNGNVRRMIVERWKLKDPWMELSHDESSSHHGFKGEETKGERIDWILVPDSFSTVEIYLEKKSFNGVWPSDHYPLLATLIPR